MLTTYLLLALVAAATAIVDHTEDLKPEFDAQARKVGEEEDIKKKYRAKLAIFNAFKERCKSGCGRGNYWTAYAWVENDGTWKKAYCKCRKEGWNLSGVSIFCSFEFFGQPLPYQPVERASNRSSQRPKKNILYSSASAAYNI